MRSILMFTAVLAIGLAGCGDGGPELCEVEGTVTLDGKPVPGAELTFIPQNVPATMMSYGGTDENGHYTLGFTATKTGAIPATHHVRIELGGKGGMKLPKKYQKDESIVKEVKSGKNVVDIQLTSN